MCASTRPRPIKRAAVAFASAAKEAPVAAQPPDPAITSVAKKPTAVRCLIAGPTVPAIRPMATVLEIVGTAKADCGRRCEVHSCCGKEVLEEDVVVRLSPEQILVPDRLGKG